MSAPRSVSPWWALVLVPIALVVGKLIGGLPAPAPKPTEHVASIAPGTTRGAVSHAPGYTFPATGSSADAGTPTGAASSPVAVSSPADQAQAPIVTGGDAVRWMSLSDALEESKRTGKPVLLDFNADWCGPCQAMKHEAFESPSHSRAIEAAVIPVTIVDRTREDGSNPADLDALQHRFDVRAFPTLIVLSPATGKAAKDVGYRGADGTEAWITQAAQAVRQ